MIWAIAGYGMVMLRGWLVVWCSSFTAPTRGVVVANHQVCVYSSSLSSDCADRVFAEGRLERVRSQFAAFSAVWARGY